MDICAAQTCSNLRKKLWANINFNSPIVNLGVIELVPIWQNWFPFEKCIVLSLAELISI